MSFQLVVNHPGPFLENYWIYHLQQLLVITITKIHMENGNLLKDYSRSFVVMYSKLLIHEH